MQTYYQKHRTIRAFQFDGTWQCLRDNLPSDLEVIRIIEVMQLIPNYSRFTYYNCYTKDINYNDQHYITDLRIDITEWPKRNMKIKHPWNHWYQLYNTKRVKKCLLPSIPYKYEYMNEFLHLNDYVVIKELNNPYIRENYRLIFYNQARFEAQWSKTPIK